MSSGHHARPPGIPSAASDTGAAGKSSASASVPGAPRISAPSGTRSSPGAPKPWQKTPSPAARPSGGANSTQSRPPSVSGRGIRSMHRW